MDRRSILSAIIRLEPRLRDLEASLADLTWDAEPVVTLTRSDIAVILDRYSRGDVDAVTVGEWANIVECREDIQFEPGHEEVILQAIYELANPELRGELSLIARSVSRTL